MERVLRSLATCWRSAAIFAWVEAMLALIWERW